MFEHGVLPAVVEMQVGVDDDADVGRAQVMLRQRLRRVAVDCAEDVVIRASMSEVLLFLSGFARQIW